MNTITILKWWSWRPAIQYTTTEANSFYFLSIRFVYLSGWVIYIVFEATFNNISVMRVPVENHQSVTSHWQTLSHNVCCIENTCAYCFFFFWMLSCNYVLIFWYLIFYICPGIIITKKIIFFNHCFYFQ